MVRAPIPSLTTLDVFRFMVRAEKVSSKHFTRRGSKYLGIVAGRLLQPAWQHYKQPLRRFRSIVLDRRWR